MNHITYMLINKTPSSETNRKYQLLVHLHDVLTLSLWHWFRAQSSWKVIHFFSMWLRKGRVLILSYKLSFTYCLNNNPALSVIWKSRKGIDSYMIVWEWCNLIIDAKWGWVAQGLTSAFWKGRQFEAPCNRALISAKWKELHNFHDSSYFKTCTSRFTKVSSVIRRKYF